jgi:hypothetical protein
VTEGADTARRGNAALTLAAMTLANSMILVDQTAVPIATPEVIAGLDGSLSEGQWVLTANVLPLAALLVSAAGLATCSAYAACSSPARSWSRSPPAWLGERRTWSY